MPRILSTVVTSIVLFAAQSLAQAHDDHDHDHDHHDHPEHHAGESLAADAHAGHSHGGFTPQMSAEELAEFCSASGAEGYDQKWHIEAIFIILAVALAGTLLPIVGKRFVTRTMGDLPFQILKLFGAGVILATAFIHMLPTAQGQLTNPCLPEIFQEYGSWAGAIALFGILFTQLIQIISVNVLTHKHSSESAIDVKEIPAHPKALEEGSATSSPPSSAHVANTTMTELTETHEVHRHSHAHADDAHVHSLVLNNAEKTVATYVLELGIASHSIIIGLTLGVATTQFTPLLIAICFHQFFEGLALSTVIMDAEFKKRSIAIAMVAFYCLTTPIGIAIGIAIHDSFNGNSRSSILTIGILDALAAGILIYDCIVNIIVAHTSSKRFRAASALRQSSHIAALWLGAFFMSLIGRWA